MSCCGIPAVFSIHAAIGVSAFAGGLLLNGIPAIFSIHAVVWRSAVAEILSYENNGSVYYMFRFRF